MSNDSISALMTVLQHGDSFFPSGANAFSWGLETLHGDGLLLGADGVAAFLRGQLRHRWWTSDAVALARTYLADADLARASEIDHELEALGFSRELREGSRRTGATLLRTHEQLATPRAADYRLLIRGGKAVGHLAVVQGLVWNGLGLSLEQALALSAHTLCAGTVSAAVRLGIMGHIDAQRVLGAMRVIVANITRQPVATEIGSFVPAAEIAAMRHEIQESRIFAN
ncbi:urease accessory UreF family protein [Acidithiobacillus ferrianus]|uniref:Urease accessory protein UreF n=2 Tax=Acidithiobacillus ferrianus TaxID=2678518 RepID=A0A845UG22_9PROT|nr:urease accessory UreF family protein [Acidithiobacillus ferrianus]NDU42824.1 urease accessory protein UreF [Acidithiobacillus ferrianus]